MKTVQYCENGFQAHVTAGMLRDEGIEAAVINERTGSVLPYASAIPDMMVQVVVNDEDYDRALGLVESIRAERSADVCPYCGSTDIGRRIVGGATRRGNVAGVLLTLLAALTFSGAGRLRSTRYCKKCNLDFE